MPEPMTDERLVELEAVCSEADDYEPGLVYDLEECCKEIRRLWEENEQLEEYEDLLKRSVRWLESKRAVPSLKKEIRAKLGLRDLPQPRQGDLT